MEQRANPALRRALSYGADLKTRDITKLSVAQLDHLALVEEIERLCEQVASQAKIIMAAQSTYWQGLRDGQRLMREDSAGSSRE